MKSLLLTLLLSTLYSQDMSWHILEKTDPITDKKILSLGRKSNEGISSLLGTQKCDLVVRANGKYNLDIYVDWKKIISINEIGVTYRIGKNKSISEKWYTSTDYSSTFAKSSKRLLKQMIGEQIIFFRVTPYGENPMTISFNLDGLDSLLNMYELSYPILNPNKKVKDPNAIEFISYDYPPVPKDPIKPVYSQSAKDEGIEGTVILSVFIDKKGFVGEVNVLKGIPDSGLDESAERAVRSVRWKPAKAGNKKVGVWISIPVNFRLK